MKYHRLGKTDIEASAVAMGCWAIAGDPTWGSQDEADSIATIHAALDVGINFFDTAEGYGNG
jgi:aryl-alcohol dehydrogenase-like predicted oxidoreductase